MSSGLILPGTIAWEVAKRELPPPPGWEEEAHRTGGNCAIIAPLGTNGLMEVVPISRALEYAYDGELALRMDEIEDDEEFEAEEEDLLWLPG